MIGRLIESRMAKVLPGPLMKAYHLLSNPRGAAHALSFLLKRDVPLPVRGRLSLLRRFYLISARVECAHSQQDILKISELVLSLPRSLEGCIVEAGAYKGGSAAKLSLVAGLAGRSLVVFDSFKGIPPNAERRVVRKAGLAFAIRFTEGAYRGTLEEARSTVARYGDSGRCRFVEGWFEETMPGFKEPIAAIFLDVDLASSTRTCLERLYPRLADGGYLVSHDAHIPLVKEVFDDPGFWMERVGCPQPAMERAGHLLIIKKRAAPPSGAVPSQRETRNRKRERGAQRRLV